VEYIAAVRFYEAQQAKLGAALIKEFEQAVALLSKQPAACRLVHPSGIRRCGLARFPYTIFFRIHSKHATNYCFCP
jgi:hypothetical protein